jgi:integrase-like protein
MESPKHGGSAPAASRTRGPGESEAEHGFWRRYWEVLRSAGVAVGREIWYERACARFIRELKPRRLKEASAEDVTQFLAVLAQQPDSAGWKIRQAAEALRVLYQDVLRCEWAAQWPVGLPEMDGCKGLWGHILR